MTMYADIEHLKNDIDTLLAQCPELADDDVLREDMLAGSTEIEDIFGAILSGIREDEITIAGIDKIVVDLNARLERAVNRRDAKRNLICKLMERCDLKKFTLPEATLSMSWHKPAPIVVDETALPDDCIKLIRKADVTAIKARCENGDAPPGVAMSNGQSVLTIRVK